MVPGEVSHVRREVAQKLFGRLAGAVVWLFGGRSLAREVARWLRVTVGVQGGHGNMEVRHGHCSGLCPGDGVGSTLFPKRKRSRHLGHGRPQAPPSCALGPLRAQPSLGVSSWPPDISSMLWEAGAM